MLVIGLTGGIGSGKSTVSQLFESLSVPVIDMDIIAHELTSSGSDTLQLISNQFGNEILFEDGSLNRKKLRQLVFQSEKSRLTLESILHPEIRNKTLERLAQLESVATPYCIVVIPLLAESTKPFPVNRVLVIDTTIEQQLKRTCQRDLIPEQTARDIISAQASRKDRLDIADDVIENNGNIDFLKSKVSELHKKYQSIAISK
jgi:dephospho-CoA kinase